MARVVVFLALALTSIRTLAEEYTLQLEPDHTQISFTLADVLHRVNGSFKLKSGEVRFDPATGIASGLIVVDVTSGDTGNKSRDRKMHKEILESSKYPEATFVPSKVSGPHTLQTQQTYEVSGTFNLHGSAHQVTLTFPITLNGSLLDTETHMVIPYVAWGLKNPSTFILRVSDKLDLDIKATGRLVETSAHKSGSN